MNSDKLQYIYDKPYDNPPSNGKNYLQYNHAMNLLGDELRKIGGETRIDKLTKERMLLLK